MKELFTRELTKKESNLFLGLVGVIGLLIAVLVARGQTITLAGSSAWFWIGCDMAACGVLGIIAPITHGEEEGD